MLDLRGRFQHFQCNIESIKHKYTKAISLYGKRIIFFNMFSIAVRPYICYYNLFSVILVCHLSVALSSVRVIRKN